MSVGEGTVDRVYQVAIEDDHWGYHRVPAERRKMRVREKGTRKEEG